MSLREDLEKLKENIGNRYTCEIICETGQACFLKVGKGEGARYIYPVGRGLFFFAPTEKGMTSEQIISKI